MDVLGVWHWVGLGVLLLILEMLGTAGFLLWLGAAALTTGVVVWLIPELTWEIQVLIFAVISIINTVLWWKFLKKRTPDNDVRTLNKRSEQYVGQRVVLIEPIVNGHGKVRIGDTSWIVKGEDLPAGTAVKVTAAEGVILKVEKVD